MNDEFNQVTWCILGGDRRTPTSPSNAGPRIRHQVSCVPESTLPAELSFMMPTKQSAAHR